MATVGPPNVIKDGYSNLGVVKFSDTTQANTANSFGVRNRIINGDMRIAQRGTSFVNVGSDLGSGASNTLQNHYTLDRWFGYRTATVSGFPIGLNVSQQPGFDGSTYCIRHQRVAGSDLYFRPLILAQIIESTNMVDLQGKNVTVSFSARAGANFSSNGISIVLQTGTTADQGAAAFTTGWTGLATSINTLSPVAASVNKYRYTAFIPKTAQEMIFYISWTPTGTAGAADYVEITNVQIEESTSTGYGSISTPFERRPYGMELSLCQRYYTSLTTFMSGSATAYPSQLHWPVIMRASPTVTAGVGLTGQSGNLPSPTGYVCRQTTLAANQVVTASAEL